MPNSIHLSFEMFPGLSEALAGKTAGDTCEAQITFMVQEIDENMVKGVVESVVPEGYEPEEEPPKTSVEDYAKTPAVIVIQPK